ncbi:hypothetical protein, partial [Shimia marina]|uniref:hypothetical protein n=1 Tax=Shimia marina TaxID=321267 RepID=UPI001F204A0F
GVLRLSRRTRKRFFKQKSPFFKKSQKYNNINGIDESHRMARMSFPPFCSPKTAEPRLIHSDTHRLTKQHLIR